MPQIAYPLHEIFLASGVVLLSAAAIVGVHLWYSLRKTPISTSLAALIGAILAFTGHLSVHLINRLDSANLLGLEMSFRWLGLVLLVAFLVSTITTVRRTTA